MALEQLVRESDEKKRERANKLITLVDEIRFYNKDDTEENDYVNSNGFKSLISNTWEAMSKEGSPQERIITLHNDLVQELKRDLKRKEARHKRHEEMKEKWKTLDTPEKKNFITKEKRDAATIKRCNDEIVKLAKKKEKLQRAELSLDDLESEDTYETIARIERRIVFLHKKIAALEGSKAKIDTLLGKKVTINSSGYLEIDKAVSEKVTKFLNSQKHKGKGAQPQFSMPDIHDIKEFITSTQLGKQIHASMSADKFLDFTKNIFSDVVAKIKKRRTLEERDIYEGFSSDEDFGKERPPPENEELQKKFQESDKQKKNVKDVIEEYTKIQEQKGLTYENCDDESSENNDDEEDDYNAYMEELDKCSDDDSSSASTANDNADEPGPSASVVDAAPSRKRVYTNVEDEDDPKASSAVRDLLSPFKKQKVDGPSTKNEAQTNGGAAVTQSENKDASSPINSVLKNLAKASVSDEKPEIEVIELD